MNSTGSKERKFESTTSASAFLHPLGMIISSDSSPLLGWTNVGIGFCFVLLDVVLSRILSLGISSSLLIASARCVVQLTIMGFYLEKVFASDNIWGVVGIVILLNVLGATEVTFNKAKGRFRNMVRLKNGLSLKY
jgi:ABC-type iron transport system FetAB permease component